jgi:hypothetical protein
LPKAVSKLLITTVRAGGVSRRWRTPGSRPNQPFVSQKAELKTSSDKTRDYYSPLEGEGFEPSVPRKRDPLFKSAHQWQRAVHNELCDRRNDQVLDAAKF